MTAEIFIAIALNLFLTVTSFIFFYIRIAERLTRVETLIEASKCEKKNN